MKKELQSRCELFMENKKKLEKFSGMDYSYIHPAVSGLLTARNVEVDPEKIKACKKLLKEKTGLFSSFRGNVTLPLVGMLSLDADPEKRMDRALALYKQLKEKFSSSEFLPLAAMILAELGSVSDAEQYIRRGSALYHLMKEEHPFLTGQEDSVFAVLLAFSEKSDEQLVSDMEQVYEELKEGGFKKHSSLTVSRIFALTDGDQHEKCVKLKNVFDSLEAHGRKYGKDYEFGALAGLTTLPVPAETLVEDLLEIDAFLSGQKGYGILGFDKKTRLLHAVMILTGFYADEGENMGAELSSITGTIALVAAFDIALIAAITASFVFSSSSTSHS